MILGFTLDSRSHLRFQAIYNDSNPTRLKVFKFAPLDFIPIIKLFHKKRFQNDHPGHTLAVLTFLTRFIMLFKSDSFIFVISSVLP